ncbi:hypothetical protein B4O97_14775 [Marispirochaeta aestuarii]|uniref:Outer membrane protein beta-barrel domain-containing protein n=1 Tax=Marispirochaeta aestuarii TaxID=1963862 RepID=A0A1Y1RWQ2_9SPIO|nr:DUF6588 family protein [Marispirochaeta aestuarii]ORC33921.1 hypothetical protein B4O97_14775 [Marispirochaeta aestuarii]
MKRLLTITTVLMLIMNFSLTAQTPDLDEFIATFEDFADDAAPSMPILADVGLRWSDSYIGGFPHFGVGTSLGFVVVPMDDIEGFFTNLGVTEVPKELKDLGGLPVPATSVEARLGGLILPFDFGIKAGYIPEFAKDSFNDVSVDYKMFGFDMRYRVMKEGLLMPEISVGAGYTYLNGMVSTSVGETTTISDPDPDPTIGPNNNLGNLTFNSPDVVFGWRSNVIDAKVQISKSFLFILRPYIGFGVSYGVSEVGGGYDADVTTDTGNGVTIQDWKNKYGSDFDDIDSDGATVYSEANGASFRAYLGTSVELLFAKLDLSGTYNPVSGAYGGQLNLRAQF